MSIPLLPLFHSLGRKAKGSRVPAFPTSFFIAKSLQRVYPRPARSLVLVPGLCETASDTLDRAIVEAGSLDVVHPLRGLCPSYALWDPAPPHKGFPTVKEKPLPKQLLGLKAKTSWSWERMCYEFHRVMGHEGPSDTTLFRYAKGKGKRPNVVIERYVQQAIEKVTAELSQK